VVGRVVGGAVISAHRESPAIDEYDRVIGIDGKLRPAADLQEIPWGLGVCAHIKGAVLGVHDRASHFYPRQFVDDLREIVDQNLRSRRNEACKADVIIDEGIRQYVEEIRSLGALDAVKEYRKMAERLREQELQRALRSLSRGDDPQQILAQLARAITNKLIHAPTAGLKQASAEGRQDLLSNARKLLGLEGKAEQPPAAADSDQAEFELPSAAVETSRRTLQ